MKRHGFALVAALWLVVVAGAVVMVGLEESVIEIGASANRSASLRAEWARHACWALALKDNATTQARLSADGAAMSPEAPPMIDSLSVTDDAWCRVDVLDLGTRLNVNLASAELVECFLGPGAEPVTAGRPFANDDELWAVLREPHTHRSLLTTRGPGQLNVNAADESLLACLPGWDRVTAAAVARARRKRTLESLPAVLAEVPLGSRERVDLRASELPTFLATESPALLVSVEGIAGYQPLHARMNVVVRRGGPLGWLVLSQEVE